MTEEAPVLRIVMRYLVDKPGHRGGWIRVGTHKTQMEAETEARKVRHAQMHTKYMLERRIAHETWEALVLYDSLDEARGMFREVAGRDAGLADMRDD